MLSKAIHLISSGHGSSISLKYMLLDCERELENLEESHTENWGMKAANHCKNSVKTDQISICLFHFDWMLFSEIYSSLYTTYYYFTKKL